MRAVGNHRPRATERSPRRSTSHSRAVPLPGDNARANAPSLPPPDGRIWLMDNMKNARLSAGVMRIKTPPPPTILKRRLKYESDFIGCGHGRVVGLSGDGATSTRPTDRAAEHPETRPPFRRPL